MRSLARFGLIGAFLVSLPVACSSGGSGGVSSEEFGARYCALFQPCCQGAGIVTEQTACKALFSFSSSKNAAAAEDCLKQYEEAAKAADWCETFSTFPRPQSCEQAYPQGNGSGGGGNTGTKPPGTECNDDDECLAPSGGEANCSYDFDLSKDFCTQYQFVGEGETCKGTRDDNLTETSGVGSGVYEVPLCNTADGLYCDYSTEKCAKQAGLDGECSSSLGCTGDDLYCSGTCKTKVAPGGSCADSWSACDDAGYCDSFGTDTCLARKPNGEGCDSNEQCESLYCDYDVCDTNPGLGGLSLLLLCQ
ncbi:MAG: hypothetical protein H6718_28655 [Polyangiaceae bacterium]|nr:hypothetical protein [Myxococcales bacterium]MCB9589419.1 hypothetical protein [Polyangiaceae bacterium]